MIWMEDSSNIFEIMKLLCMLKSSQWVQKMVVALGRKESIGETPQRIV
jgi:hypothetical protein